MSSKCSNAKPKASASSSPRKTTAAPKSWAVKSTRTKPLTAAAAKLPQDNPLRPPSDKVIGGGYPWNVPLCLEILTERTAADPLKTREQLLAEPWTDPVTGKQWPLPSTNTFRYWSAKLEHYDQWAVIRQMHSEALLEYAEQEALDDSQDWIKVDGRMVPNTPRLARTKMQVETARWRAERLLKPYNPKQQIEHSGTVNTTVLALEALRAEANGKQISHDAQEKIGQVIEGELDDED